MTLLELADEVERAEGPDRELDAAIYEATPHAIDYQRIGIRLNDRSRLNRYHDGWVTVYGAKGESDPYPEDLPRFTASLDAARTLIGDEHWRVEDHPLAGPCAVVGEQEGYAPTVERALVAAALRARAAIKG